jgi:hypothetical protein
MAVVKNKTMVVGADANLLARFRNRVESFLGLKNKMDEEMVKIKLNTGATTVPKRINIEKKSDKVLLWRKRNKIAAHSRRMNRLRFA